MGTTITVETPEGETPPETPPVETLPAAIVVAAPPATPEGLTDVAVMVGTLVAKVDQMETTLNSVKYTAEDALAIANRLANPPVVAEPEPIQEVVIAQADDVDDGPAPKSKRHWLAEILL
jgi:hypothetical protein